MNSEAELKPRWTKYCVQFVAGTENDFNDNENANNNIFIIKSTKLYVSVVLE